MALSDVAEWKQARQWLINTAVIPATHPVTKPTVDLVDFARSLRDGVFLCNLLQKLKPGCVENFNPRPIAQHTFLKNISSFLVACKVHFKIATNDLFEDSDLYEVTNFGKVVLLLSVLSHTSESTNHGWEAFPKDVHHEYYHDLDLLLAGQEEPPNDRESIYANLNELAMERESDVSIYDHAPTAVAADEDPYADSGIYEAVVHKKHPQKATASTGVAEKKSYILQELYETELNYVTVLNLIGMNFYAAMKGYCTTEENNLLFGLPQLLKDCHEVLVKGFLQCYEQGQADIFTCFHNQKDALLHYGEYAALLPLATAKAKQLQNARNEVSRSMINCQELSQQRFSLAELLSVPLQRVLKYPLLVSELIKCAKKGGTQAEVADLTKLHTFLSDISKYINETKRDFEVIKTIEDIEQSLVEYRGPPLKECGRLRFDGELRVKLAEERGDLKKRWAFLFDKILLICKRGNFIRTFGEVKYMVKYMLTVDGMHVGPESHRHHSIKKPPGLQPFKLTAVEVNSNTVRDYSANGKSEDHREAWIGGIKVAQNICCPTYARHGGHFFELTTSGAAVSCSACERLLWGMYHQGYFCKDCNKFSHTDCLVKHGDCIKTSPRAMTMLPSPSASVPVSAHHHMQRSRSASNPPIALPQPSPPLPYSGRSSKANGELSKKGKIYVAKMRYDGNPLRARKGHYLSFDKDERLEILEQTDAEWWEAISLITGNKGKVPAAYLKLEEYENYTKRFDVSKTTTDGGGGTCRFLPTQNSSSSFPPPKSPPSKKPSNDSLADFSWFVGCLSRIDAENMLKDLPDGVFLIRESDQRRGEYAVGLRWRQHPKHIKISVNPHSNRFYVSDAKDFDSVADLVQYYQDHSLGYSFPGVDTTLRCPYWDVRKPSGPQRPPPVPPARPPQSISLLVPVYCEAMYNFQAEFTEELSLEKHCHVKLIKKDTHRPQWWLGEYKGQSGLFPSNYVRELPPGH